jgi:hypothetical protein
MSKFSGARNSSASRTDLARSNLAATEPRRPIMERSSRASSSLSSTSRILIDGSLISAGLAGGDLRAE